MQRGDAKLGPCYVRYQSVFRIAERWVRAPLEQTIRIYPDLEDAKRHSMYLLRSRQIALEKRHTRMRGIGREFESLREYQDGDEYRDICWTASARRAKLAAAKLANASTHHAQAHPCGTPVAACSTAGTSNADSVMPNPVPP